jgi:hypothetical protein
MVKDMKTKVRDESFMVGDGRKKVDGWWWQGTLVLEL